MASNNVTDAKRLSVTAERVAVANEFVAGAQLAVLHQWQLPQQRSESYHLAKMAGNLFVGLEDICLRTDDDDHLGLQYDKESITRQADNYPELWGRVTKKMLESFGTEMRPVTCHELLKLKHPKPSRRSKLVVTMIIQLLPNPS